MARIVSIGAAVQDVFLTGPAFKAVKEFDGDYVEEFPLGAKIEVEQVYFTTGGGGTNSAVTFSRQGHDSQFVGVIGTDPAGEAVLRDLKQENVNVDDVITTNKYNTGYSTLLLAPSGERTILTYRGASAHFHKEDFDLEHLDADWFYITSLAGNLELLEYLLILAESKKIKVALDPGGKELAETDKLRKLLPKLTLLKGNRDELGKLVNANHPEEVVLELSKLVPYVAVTDGGVGSIATDGKRLIKAGMYADVPVVDRTGAGDAFGSGFVAALARGEDLESAVTLASANSTSVVRQVGAKAGILKKNESLDKMPLEVKEL